jgi:hypothetical protein
LDEENKLNYSPIGVSRTMPREDHGLKFCVTDSETSIQQEANVDLKVEELVKTPFYWQSSQASLFMKKETLML